MIKINVIVLCLLLLSCSKTEEKAKNNENYNFVWEENFNDSNLNTSDWIFETGANGWGNNELQNYTDSGNIEISNGTLKIIAKKIAATQNVGDFTSARLNSVRKFKYGKIEVRAKLPTHIGNGLWPAIWMLGDSPTWPDCGEMDIMEYVSHVPNTVYATVHSKTFNHVNGNEITSGNINLPSAEEEFHVYGILWEEMSIKFYIDTPLNTTLVVNRPAIYNNDTWPFDKPFYFLLNIAVGGDWGGQNGVNDVVFPATMEIDYVKVYQK